MVRALVLALLLSLMPATGAMAETPGPSTTITGDTRDGTFRDDWYAFAVAAGAVVTVTADPSQCPSQMYPNEIELYNPLGVKVAGAPIKPTEPVSVSTLPAAQVTRYILRVKDLCAVDYRISLGPTAAIVEGPTSASTPLTADKNQTIYRAYGPLSGATIHTSDISIEEDVDWFTFFANGAFTLNGVGHSVRVAVYDDSFTQVAGGLLGHDDFTSLEIPANGWRQYFVEFWPEYEEFPRPYAFALEPASAIPLTPSPTMAAPAALKGLKVRKAKGSAIVTWPAVRGATMYQYRVRRDRGWTRWLRLGELRVTLPAPRKPLRVQVLPSNPVGEGKRGRLTIPGS